MFGEEAGSLNDVTIYRRSGMEDDLSSYLAADDQILFDGIYYFMGHPFLCPFTTHNHHILSQYEKDWNDAQRAARVIIENVFGVTKNRFQIISNKCIFDKETIGKVARCAFIMNNIIITHQSPLRN